MTKIPALARPEDLDMPPCSCGVLRVFRTLMKSGVSDAWGRSPIMSASKCGAEFTEQVVPRDRSTIPAGGRSREILRAGSCGPWATGSRNGARSIQNPGRRIRRARRTPETTTIEGRTPRSPNGSRAPGKKRRPSSAPGTPGEHRVRIHPQRRRQPPLSGPVCRWGGNIPGPVTTPAGGRPGSATARRRQEPGRHHSRVLRRVRADSAATGRIRAELARHGIQASAPERPEDHGRQRHDSLSTQKEGPNHHPGRGPPGPAGQAPQERHRRRAGGDTGR